MPRFSSSAPNDEVVASIIMMASMQKYFSYFCSVFCGILSATLLGEKANYEQILKKLDNLPTLGGEPAQFADLLRPVIKRMIRTFEDPEETSFWQHILDVKSGSGSTEYTGWVTAFCFWDDKGNCLYRLQDHDDHQEYSESCPFGVVIEELNNGFHMYHHRDLHLMLNGIKYHRIEQD
jgi:hypothetical protein